MPIDIALQLYTLRDFTKTPADIAKTLARVKKIGYNAVQCSALGPIEPAELAKILKNEGLVCAATHQGLDQLNDSAKAIENHKLWGCSYTAIGGFWPKESTKETWSEFIANYNALAKKFAGSGVSIGYHNHEHELVKLGDKTIQQTLVDSLSKDIWFEIDTYWIAYGGGDPAAWIEKLAGRIPAVHFKDLGMLNGQTQQMREIGEGNLNWPRILQACKAAGVKWHIIEQDNCNGVDPFECVERSLKNLQAMS
jgi:sugar phosphate isomerase/epimerase